MRKLRRVLGFGKPEQPESGNKAGLEKAAEAAVDPMSIEQAALQRRATETLNALAVRPCLRAGFRHGMRKPTDPEVRTCRDNHAVSGPVLVQVPGASDVWMYVENDDNVALNFFYLGRGSYETLSTVVFSVLSTSATNVLDVGGHSGLFSLVAAASNQDALVHYFELMPGIAARAKTNVRISGFEDRVRLNVLGVSDTAGEMQVHYNKKWPLWTGASLESIADRVGLDGAVTTEVPVTTLDDYWIANERFECELVKIDVEEHELSVFKGASAFLLSQQPWLLCEILSQNNLVSFAKALQPLGYDRIFEIDDRANEVREMDMSLCYKNGTPYEFQEFQNVLFCANPLPDNFSSALSEAFVEAQMNEPTTI
jgi:FkbM family methyltransferase